jgi:hypothetical protein
MLMAQQQM